MTRLLEYLSRQPRGLLTFSALAAAVLIALLDRVTGPEVSLFALYLLPVLLVAAAAGRRPALLTSLISSVGWALSHAAHPRNYQGPWITLWDVSTRLAQLLLLSWVVSALKAALDRERASSRTDALTGLPNRRSFYDLLEAELRRAARYRRPLTLVYLDVDNFKAVNDRYGHAGGDLCLQTVAAAIYDELRRTDVVARLGGDEFVLMLPETPPHAAQVVLPKLRRRLAEVAAMNKWPISYSIGAVTFMDPVVTPDEAVKLADDLMYAVKHNGKDRVSHQIVEDPDWEERLVRNRLRRSG